MDARLRAELDAIASDPRTAYAVQMWRYALDHADTFIPAHENCDAIPYLPIKPEAYGLALTAQHRILDIGCLGGYGLFDMTRCLAAAGCEIPAMVGVDIDPASVDMGRRMAAIWAGERGEGRWTEGAGRGTRGEGGGFGSR